MSGHLLALERPLIERLRAHLPYGVRVLTHAALPEIGSGAHSAPAVVVLYGGAEVTESVHGGGAVRMRQDWVVLIVAREVAEDPDAATAAGPIAETVISALIGWRPADPHIRNLELVELPPPEYVSGNLWLPLTFSAEIVRVRQK